MSKHVPQIIYCSVSGLYWMLYGVAAAFSSVYLLSCGYSNTQIGYILCAGFLLGAVGQLLLAGAADRSERLSPAGFMLLPLLLFGAALTGLSLCAERSVLLSASYILLFSSVIAAQPFLFSLAFYLERCGEAVNFGVARGLGSFGYALISAALGVWIAHRGICVVRTAGWLVLALLALLLAYLLRRYPFRGRTVITAAHRRGGLLRRYRGFALFMAGTATLFVGHGIVNNFLFQIVQRVGGSESDLGTLSAFLAMMELPVMCGFSFIARRFPVRRLLLVSAALFVVKVGAVALAGSMPMLYAAFALQSVSYALFASASIYYIGRLMDLEDANRGQACSTAMNSVGNILASFFGGLLIDRFTLGGALTVAVGATVVGTLLIAAMYLSLRTPRFDRAKGDL